MRAALLTAAAGLLTVLIMLVTACRMQVVFVNGNPADHSVAADMDARKDVGVSPAVGVAMPGGSADAQSVSVNPSATASTAATGEATPTTPTVRK